MANETLGQKLRALQASIVPTFKSVAAGEKDESELAKLQVKIEKLGKLHLEIRQQFDTAIDMTNLGMFGAEFTPAVTRIRAKKAVKNQGPATVKPDPLADLDI